MIDIALALYLVFLLPAYQIWKSVHRKEARPRTRSERYLSSIRQIAILLAVLLLACWWHGHAAASLGLALPSSGLALWTLLIPLILLPLMHFIGKRQERKLDAAALAAHQDKIRKNDNIPRTPAEMRLFVVLSFFMGGGWELLYRGFLIMVLSPWLGTWGAVLVSGMSYGCGHGYHGPKQMVASMGMALVLSVAYVLTGSLWWLIIIHIGMPWMGGAAYYKVLTASQHASTEAPATP